MNTKPFHFFLLSVLLFSLVGSPSAALPQRAAPSQLPQPIHSSPPDPRLPAESLTLYADADAGLRADQPTRNLGDALLLPAAWSSGSESVSLLHFDLGSLPAGAVIDSATLGLYLVETSGASPVDLGLYWVTTAWDEMTVTWNSAPSWGTVGLNWQVDNLPGAYKQHDVTSWAVAWLAGDHNHGLALRGPHALDTPAYGRWFSSRESAAGQRPSLDIRYHLPLPDLVIPDLWHTADQVCYRLMNQGEAVAPHGTLTALRVDGQPFAVSTVSVDLLPGNSWQACFEPDWSCTPDQDTVEAIADSTGLLAESNKSNNTTTRTWPCDRTPPVITSGPVVQSLTQSTARITWETNEASDSQVRFDRQAARFALSAGSPALTASHQVDLAGLDPGATYHFFVQSTDASSNTVSSREGFFTTAIPPDSQAPGVTLPDPGELHGTAMINADAWDDQAVERVEFYLDGVLAFTDYSSPYQFPLDTLPLADGSHNFSARAFDRAGHTTVAQRDVSVVNLKDLSIPQVTILTPTQNASVQGLVTIQASASDDTGLFIAYLTIAKGTELVKLDSYTFPSSSKTGKVTFTLDTTRIVNGSYRLGLEVRDKELKPSYVSVDVLVANPPKPKLPPKLVVVKHEARRQGNHFTVTIQLENTGQETASNISLVDWMSGFQPISRTTSSEVQQAFWLAKAYLKIKSQADIAAGASQTFSYDAIPILEYPVTEPVYSFGDPLFLYYSAPSGKAYSDTYNTPLYYAADGDHLKVSHGKATQAANYLIITNPARLYMYTVSKSLDEVNNLLSLMAQLAYEKYGVLGYYYGSDPAALDMLLSPGPFWILAPGTVFGNWATKMHPDFVKTLKGYVLFVGETEIIPSPNYNPSTGPLRYSDTYYADRKGNDARPELIVGRIVGNTARKLAKPILASLGVLKGWSGYSFDRSDALVASGGDGGMDTWIDEAGQVADIVDDEFKVQSLHCQDHLYVKSLSSAYSSGDGFVAGDITGDSRAELVVGDTTTNKIYVYSNSGASLASFNAGYNAVRYESGDRLAIANKLILMMDTSADRLLEYGYTGIVNNSFALESEPGDAIAAADVTGDSYQELIFADASADTIYIYNTNGTLLSQFSYAFDSSNTLAAGVVLPSYTKGQVILADRDDGSVRVYSPSGNQLYNFDGGFTSGDALAVGNVLDDSYASIVIAGHTTGRVNVFRYYVPDSGSPGFENGFDYPSNFTTDGGLAIGDVVYGSRQEILLAAASGGAVDVTMTNCYDRFNPIFKAALKDKDLIFFDDHGNPYEWVDAIGTGEMPVSLGGSNPVIIAAACSTGNYEPLGDYGISEAFLESGAAVYIGSTVPYAAGADSNNNLFKRWVSQDKSIGLAFSQHETDMIDNYQDTSWVREFNLYGDPKFGGSNASSAPPARSEAQRSSPAVPQTAIQVDIPPYQVTHKHGADIVAIPGGQVLYQEGQPQVPFYTLKLDYPSGDQVQGVAMTERSGLVITSGLTLSTTHLIIKSPLALTASLPAAGPGEPGWFPQVDYDWRVYPQPDGSSQLVIRVFPFIYNRLTSQAQFSSHYAFAIDMADSPVEIRLLSLRQPVYHPGDPVDIEAGVANRGERQDVMASLVIRDAGSGEPVAGLLLQSLAGLPALASFASSWDSRGFPAGGYLAELTLLDSAGRLLARQQVRFQLGVAAAQITAFQVTPPHFTPGQSLSARLDFRNSGDSPLSGTAVVTVQNAAGETLRQFTHDFAGLAPAAARSFEDTWDTSSLPAGSYFFTASLLYDGVAADPWRSLVSTETFLFTPLLMR